MDNIIYSAGYRSKHDLLTWLAEEGIQRVVDVRFSPWGKGPWAKSLLTERLTAAGIAYTWMEAAGNPYYKERDLAFMLKAYAQHLDQTDVIERLERLAERQHVVLLCACGKRARCHRGVILDRLEARGWTVKDLEDKAGAQASLFG